MNPGLCTNNVVKVAFNAADPSINISLRQARTSVRKIIAGLQSFGLEKGSCVCLHSFNDVRYPLLSARLVLALVSSHPQHG